VPHGAGLTGTGLSGAGLSGTAYLGAGHNGASAADVLGELRALRTLLGPLLAATEPTPVPPPRPAQQSWPAQESRSEQALPAQSRQAGGLLSGGLLAGDDELRTLADSEEAWW
jgi:hypothetical protein